MGIPRKGSRHIDVDGKPFRYIVREDGPVVKDDDDPSMDYKKPQREFLLVTLQEDVERPGRVCQVRLAGGTEVSPELIRQTIREATRGGWDPSSRGGPFQIQAP